MHMLEGLPAELPIAFALITLITFVLLRRLFTSAASAQTQRLSGRVTGAMVAWLILQAVLSFFGVYQNADAMPPRIFLFGVLPTLVAIAAVFIARSGREIIDSLSLVQVTTIHTIRIFVELVLWWLFLVHAVPEVMTFEGRNLDIIAGFTAPLVAWFGIQRRMFGRSTLILWNVLCLGLLLNIVIIAVRAVPSPIQQLAFDQPNRAVLYFPFSWLPSFVVPVVLFCHLTAIRQLMKQHQK